MRDEDDFYEDDEPVEKIREAFRRGDKGITGKDGPGRSSGNARVKGVHSSNPQVDVALHSPNSGQNPVRSPRRAVPTGV